MNLRYPCLGYHDERMWEALNERDRAALTEETFAYGTMLRNN